MHGMTLSGGSGVCQEWLTKWEVGLVRCWVGHGKWYNMNVKDVTILGLSSSIQSVTTKWHRQGGLQPKEIYFLLRVPGVFLGWPDSLPSCSYPRTWLAEALPSLICSSQVLYRDGRVISISAGHEREKNSEGYIWMSLGATSWSGTYFHWYLFHCLELLNMITSNW